ncbi:MAG: nuclear transport factor 2 family protein [Pseudomonadota bacterium]
MKPGRLVVIAMLLGFSMAGVAAEKLEDRLGRLEAEVQAASDISAVMRLQRTYGYFVDKGMWADLAEYFTNDAVANYPAGTFIGKPSIREHLFRNVGNVPLGQVGLGDNRVYNHFSIQPVVNLDPGGKTAKGRWRVIAMFGSFGGNATWAEGVYEMQYAKEGGVWKIARLDYYSGFGASYATGWVAPPQPAGGAAPAPRAPRQLAHPADRLREVSCEGFPAACIVPFHYANPGKGAGSPVWTLPAKTSGVEGDTSQRTARLLSKARQLADEQEIENLLRTYGFYLDRAYWEQVADLFADDGTIEFAQQGVYVGKKRVREFLGKLGPHGLVPGWMNDHMQLQPVVTVLADNNTAWSRNREWAMTGRLGETGQWAEGIYENQYVKQGGVWKIKSMHFYPTFITDYDKGWAKDAKPAPGPLADLPPDRPPSSVYAIYPKAHVPPYHYTNAVTGKPLQYPTAGGPSAKELAQVLAREEVKAPPPVRDVKVAADEIERLVGRVKSVHEIENLGSAYGYYLDKNLYTDLADLFDPQLGSIELAHRGVYRGPKVREFLQKVFGRGGEGPVAGRLGNHIQVQPVITLSADGKTAKIRSRMLQQMSQGNRASWGGAIYENEAVRGADGVWRYSKVNAWNTFSANYEGGWTKAAGSGMPGPNPEIVAPDSPPTRQIAMYPVVYEIPYHYANPVSGRTALPALMPMAQQQAQLPAQAAPAPRQPAAAPAAPVAPPSGAALPAPAGMPANVAAGLREIGAKVDGAKTGALYAPLHAALKHDAVEVRRDLAYGPHDRHRADVFLPKAPAARRALVVFVHGGGFSRGAKSTAGQFYYDNIGYWAAEHGLVGVTINYRLSPEFKYPSGAEDLERVVSWVREHASEWGADPARIFLWGHSAGGAHVADYLVRTAKPPVAGAILTSGIYDLGTTVSVWKDYYGEDIALYPQRSSLPKLIQVRLPMLVNWAELDPPDFIPDTEKLIAGRKAANMPTTSLRLPNHSHLSEAYAVGTADDSLTGPVLKFIEVPSK